MGKKDKKDKMHSSIENDISSNESHEEPQLAIDLYIYITIGIVFMIFIMILAILIILIILLRNKQVIQKLF
jgi:heme/copper-type cytochrome/quinol oxidase subunit 2